MNKSHVEFIIPKWQKKNSHIEQKDQEGLFFDILQKSPL